MEIKEWLRCPVCGNKTRNQVRKDTIMQNFPLFCPKCKQECLIDVKDLQITVIKEPDDKRRADELVRELIAHQLCFFM